MFDNFAVFSKAYHLLLIPLCFNGGGISFLDEFTLLLMVVDSVFSDQK